MALPRYDFDHIGDRYCRYHLNPNPWCSQQKTYFWVCVILNLYQPSNDPPPLDGVETWRGFIDKLPTDEDKSILTKLLNDVTDILLR